MNGTGAVLRLDGSAGMCCVLTQTTNGTSPVDRRARADHFHGTTPTSSRNDCLVAFPKVVERDAVGRLKKATNIDFQARDGWIK